jgi:hypothetical protein
MTADAANHGSAGVAERTENRTEHSPNNALRPTPAGAMISRRGERHR